jgi:hypothetical protein
MSTRWCGRCRAQREIEWSADISFGPRAESARCPACGAVWGVRERRKGPFEQSVRRRMEETDEAARHFDSAPLP